MGSFFGVAKRFFFGVGSGAFAGENVSFPSTSVASFPGPYGMRWCSYDSRGFARVVRDGDAAAFFLTSRSFLFLSFAFFAARCSLAFSVSFGLRFGFVTFGSSGFRFGGMVTELLRQQRNLRRGTKSKQGSSVSHGKKWAELPPTPWGRYKILGIASAHPEGTSSCRVSSTHHRLYWNGTVATRIVVLDRNVSESTTTTTACRTGGAYALSASS